jgi:hypothetical protein
MLTISSLWRLAVLTGVLSHFIAACNIKLVYEQLYPCMAAMTHELTTLSGDDTQVDWGLISTLYARLPG